MGVYQDVLYREPRTGCRSGCKALLAHAHSLGYSDKGCFNPASVVPGGGPSIHTVGRAVDLWWGDSEHNRFDAFVSLLADHAEELGIQQILWDGDGWSYNRPYWHPLTAPTDMHRDHAHIELTIDAADTLTVEQIAQVLTPTEADMTLDEYTRTWGPNAERGLAGVITLPLLETYDPDPAKCVYKRYAVGDVLIFVHQNQKLREARGQ